MSFTLACFKHITMIYAETVCVWWRDGWTTVAQINLVLCLGPAKMSFSSSSPTTPWPIIACFLQGSVQGPSGRWDKQPSKSCRRRHYVHLRCLYVQVKKKKRKKTREYGPVLEWWGEGGIDCLFSKKNLR